MFKSQVFFRVLLDKSPGLCNRSCEQLVVGPLAGTQTKSAILSELERFCGHCERLIAVLSDTKTKEKLSPYQISCTLFYL